MTNEELDKLINDIELLDKFENEIEFEDKINNKKARKVLKYIDEGKNNMNFFKKYVKNNRDELED